MPPVAIYAACRSDADDDDVDGVQDGGDDGIDHRSRVVARVAQLLGGMVGIQKKDTGFKRN